MSQEEKLIAEGAPVEARLVREGNPKGGAFKRFLANIRKREYSYLFYAFIIPIILNYLIYVAMQIHPFGNGSVLVLDLNGQYVYFYEALRNAVQGETSMIYSFCRAMGGEFMGIYAYYVASPFSYIVCLFPEDRMLEALLFIFLLKTGISGVTMGYYLHKISSKVNKVSVVLFSILYSLSTYAVIQQHNSMWIDALMWLPLLTLGIEQLIKNKKYKLFTFLLAVTLMSNFYIGYMTCIYVVIYFFYYYFAHNTEGKNNPTGEENHFAKSLLRIIVFSIIGIGIAFAVVWSAYYSLQFGKNTFSNPNFDLDIRFDILDYFTKFLPGTYDTVRPEGLPFVYCGVLTLFCVPLYFMAKKFSLREKLYSAGVIIVFSLSFSLNTIDMVWHGFQKPNWLNYRYSFMLCFFLLVLAYKGYGEVRKFSAKIIGLLTGFYIFLLAVAQKFEFHSYAERPSGNDIVFDQKLKTMEVVWFSLICFVLFGIGLCVACKTRHRENITLILCVITCLEVFTNGLVCCNEFGNDVIYSNYSGYNDFLKAVRPMTEDILEYDPGFYRFEKNVHRKYCDNMALNVRGLSVSTSTLNKETISFLASMGYASKSHWSKYLGGTPINDSILGLKYIIGCEKDNLDLYYEKTDIEPITYSGTEWYTYYNPYALSIAYAVDRKTSEFDMSKGSSVMMRLNELVSTMAGEEETVEIFKPIHFDVSLTNCIESTIGDYYKYAAQTVGNDVIVTYVFDAPQDGEIFFYLPVDIYGREVKLRVNGASKDTYGANETCRIISLGSFTAGTEVKLAMTLSADVLYVKKGENGNPYYNAVFYIDQENLKAEFGKLAESQMEVSEDWDSENLPGKITTTAEDQMILTTLAYDEGWKITVDGQPVEIFKALNSVIAFDITEPGEHVIEMKYRPACVVVGRVISIAFTVLFILIVIFEKYIFAFCGKIFAPVDADNGGKKRYTGDLYDDEADDEAKALEAARDAAEAVGTPSPEPEDGNKGDAE